ncbi:hypothetical protein G210_0295 [Candida maltosa Xu316]|uniref:DNA mismatch repair proteins mutS family domain-containing protein n=1 Tax=Candida maltosa (strain Xu316) TaxID=1245528 RepID=M3K2S5_CANMX|nr:hypothetical protein G210_0295 [Candida maltosa Xu316]
MTDVSTEGSKYGFVTVNEYSISKRRKLQLTEDRAETVLSLFKSRSDSMEMGMACLNVRTIKLDLSNFSDSSTFARTVNMLQVYEPTIVIIPNIQLNPQFEKLKYILESNMPERTKLILEKSKLFNTSNGLNMIKLYTDANESTLEQTVLGKELSVAAANACINYCINSRHFRTTNKIRLFFTNCESTMAIDANTIRDLELVQSLAEGGTTLFSFLNHCVTKMGQRMLRASVLQPLTHENSIKLRLDSVHELMTNEDILINIRSQMKQTRDLENAFASFLEPKCISGQDQAINNVILLKTVLKNSFSIRRNLQYMHSHLLAQVKQILDHDSIQLALETINHYINEDCQWANNSLELANQRANAVKSGVNGLLDVSRRVREKLLEEVSEMVNQLSEDLEMGLDYRYESTRGFFIKIKSDKVKVDDLPNVFINTMVKKKTIECTTIDLMKQSARYNDIVSEITTLNSTIIEDLYTKINEYIPILLMVSEAIGTLDLLCSLAYFISIQKVSYICPEFNSSLTIVRSYHPILANLIHDFVPNNYSAAQEISRFQIITGANMSGKSVYLRQLAYIIIMAQIGCFIPAEYAKLRIFGFLYSRLSSDNNNEMHASSFSKEMIDMVSILKDSNDNSLVLIDELGRGSSLSDGFSICLAILEKLLNSGAFVFTSTHFKDIAEVLSNKLCVSTSHMETDDANGALVMKYNLVSGVNEQVGYGIRYAEYSRLLPDSLIDHAKQIALVLRTRNPIHGNQEQKLTAERRKLI